MKTKLPFLLPILLALTLAPAGAAVRYVNLANPSPAPPYTSWATAATNIQDAIDAALPGDGIVVTNGVYQTGGRTVDGTTTNRMVVDKPLTVRSVNGPEVTVIDGASEVRCVYLTNGASLFGFTLTNGTAQRGGGVWCESETSVVSDCIVGGNSAFIDCHGFIECGAEGGGAYRGTLNNCTILGNWAASTRISSGGNGGGVAFSTLNNCTLTANQAQAAAYPGGGASGGHGGAAYASTLNYCTLTSNSASSGGGAFAGTLNNCTLTGNSAGYGGGAGGSALNDCTLTGNSASYGGGVSRSTLNNCSLTGNSAYNYGGGAYSATLNNCTVTGNLAVYGGGVAGGMVNNSIVYFNSATNDGANYSRSLIILGEGAVEYYDVILNYCCTTPLPPNGVGNLTAEPQLASTSHLSANSPCRGAGSHAYATGADIDGEPWANPPSIGCDEVHSGAETGPLSVAIQAIFTNVATGFEVNFTAQIDGNLSASRWEFGDGTVVSNRPYAAHAWQEAGDYPVVLRAYNESYPAGVSATVIVHVVVDVHYVAADSRSPVAPYRSWATAATNIQDAVDSAYAVGALVLVSNGVYQTGGHVLDELETNRVAVTKILTLRSVNGPEVTIIDGASAMRCVYLTNGAVLVGFTLTHGAAKYGGGLVCHSAGAEVSNCVLTGNSAYRSDGHESNGGGAAGGSLNNCTINSNSAGWHGGGASGGKLNNCTLTGNSAQGSGGGALYSALNNCTLIDNWAGSGGGAFGGTLNNCVLTRNSARYYGGGGAYDATLNNCTLTWNSAQYYGGGAHDGTLKNCTLSGNSATLSGGGASYSALNNCIAYFNTAPNGENYFESSWNYCCTTPHPGGAGNFTNAPLFVDQAGGNLRLQSNSPCINSGLNAYAPTVSDLGDNPRIVGGTVDVGAYEFQSPQSAISYAWLQQFALPIDPSTDSADPDGDRFNNWQEWHAGTDPTNAQSVLRLLLPTLTGPDLVVTWESVLGRGYVLEGSTNLSARFAPLASHLSAADPFITTTSFTHTNAARTGPWFYRVRVEE